MQGRVDLGGALASVSPGLNAVVDFLIAAAGDSRAPNGGFNVDLMGGFENLAHNSCVPVTDAPALPVIPVAELLNQNVHPNGRDSHIGVGVSEDFVNYAAWKIFDSGMLCLNVGTGLDQQLSGKALGVLFTVTNNARNSLGRLTFPESASNSAFGIQMRPQLAPIVSFGDNDVATDLRLVNVVIPAMELDFYAWAQDRYVRFFTLKADITIGVDVPIENNTIAIDAGRDLDIGLVNADIINDELVMEDSAGVVSLLTNVIGAVAGALGGAIPPIPINDMLGGAALPNGDPLPVGINLGADALAPFSEGDSRFLGVFVELTEPATGMMLAARPQAQVRVTKVNVPENKDGFYGAAFGTGPAPSIEIALSANAPAGAEVEYSYHLTNSGWSEWSSSNYAIIEDPSLYLQQWHKVYARARLKGQPDTTAWTSATADFLIDVAAPDVQVTKAGDTVEIMAFDFLTSAAEIEYRYRNPGDEFSEWAKMGAQTIALEDAGADAEVQVRDSAGNIGSNVAGLRGIADPSVAVGGCACTVAGPTGQGGPSPLALLLSGLVFGVVLLRRRKRS
jgi:MYXO-CTERM domain-containing protein